MQYKSPIKPGRLLVAAATLAALAAIGAPGIASPQAATGNAVRGKTVFARCAACHSVKPGEKRMGPNLAGVVRRSAASAPGFKYSAAMRASGLAWTPQNLDRFLKAPSTVVRGTSMAAPGIASDADRADLIAYLAAAPAK